jgi:anti-sigma factor RsiW
MKAEGCREWRERIGALLLGQLPEEERFATEAHLDGCPACRAEAEALDPVASLLGLSIIHISEPTRPYKI